MLACTIGKARCGAICVPTLPVPGPRLQIHGQEVETEGALGSGRGTALNDQLCTQTRVFGL